MKQQVRLSILLLYSLVLHYQSGRGGGRRMKGLSLFSQEVEFLRSLSLLERELLGWVGINRLAIDRMG